ncbi:hypothetical protein BDR26DRAFT_930856 [Obelidium mucronatum]|nr:hypothetical protein BDR26DRAFT_930856 [Obelidium mucronatum]
MFTISARKAHLSDAAAIAAVHIKSWNESMRPLKVYSDAHIDMVNARRLAQYKEGLRSVENGESDRLYVVATAVTAEGVSKVIGICIMGTSRLMEAYPDYPLELMALYLGSEYYGSGAATKMIEEGIRLLGWTKESGKMLCEALEVNERAVKFYKKIGGAIIGREVTTKYGGFAVPMVTFGWDQVPIFR